jgi:hypothetical protein
MYKQYDIARILARDELSFEDVKNVMRCVRYQWGGVVASGPNERIEYANTLLPHAEDYLPPLALFALVRADMNEEDAAACVDRNKAFFSRLTTLLPSLVRFFGEEARSKNLEGLISSIDDCHNDFHVAAASSRKDRKLREAKEKLANASKLVNELSAALADPMIFHDGICHTHTRIEFDRYREVYCSASDRRSSIDIGDLIRGLQICGGVLEILNATAEMRPERLFLSSNDARTTVVEYAYHTCTIWNGPKLVTTPGSDFSTLCSLLYEAVSGKRDESLAGAINRYARSDDRRQWDREGQEAEAEDDDFADQKRVMAVSAEEIKLCEALLEDRSLSNIAKALLRMRINHEQRKYEASRSACSTRQAPKAEQSDNTLDINDLISRGAEFDIILGRMRRLMRSDKIDV